MSSDPVNRVLALRQLLRERFPSAHALAPALSSSAEWRVEASAGAEWARVDFSLGEIVEVVAPHPGSGGALLIGDLLDRAVLEERLLALVDGKDSFDPDSFDSAQCGRLLWLRCQDASQALQATDLLLRDGNLPAILLDLQLNSPEEIRSLPSSAWHRFRGLAERSGAGLIVLTPAPLVTSAQQRFSLDLPHPSWALDMPREELSARSQPRLTRRRNVPQKLPA
jgi:hypothetical protein